MFSGGASSKVITNLPRVVEDHIVNNGLERVLGAEIQEEWGQNLYTFQAESCFVYTQAEAQRLLTQGVHGPLVEGLVGLSRFCLSATEASYPQRERIQSHLEAVDFVNEIASRAACEVAVENLVLLDAAVCQEAPGILREVDDARRPQFLKEVATRVYRQSNISPYDFKLAFLYSAALLKGDQEGTDWLKMARIQATSDFIDGLKADGVSALEEGNGVAVPQLVENLEELLRFIDGHHGSTPMGDALREKAHSALLPLETFLKVKNLERKMYGSAYARQNGEFARDSKQVVKALSDLVAVFNQARVSQVSVATGQQPELLEMAQQYSQMGQVATAVQLINQYFTVNGGLVGRGDVIATLGY